MEIIAYLFIIAILLGGIYLSAKGFAYTQKDNSEKPTPKSPENPNKSRMDMRHDIINAGFKMFRNVDTFWNTWEKQEKWHGPMVCWGVDFNNLIYNTPCGDYTMVRDLTPEEMDRLVCEIRKTDGLVELLNSGKVPEDA